MGNNFIICATRGHIADIAKGRSAIDIKNNFQVKLELTERGKKSLLRIQKALKGASEIYIATKVDKNGAEIAGEILTFLQTELQPKHISLPDLTDMDFRRSACISEIISAIEDTENIYEAFDEYKNKNYSTAEDTLRLVSDLKKSEEDYTKLRKGLNSTYLINTTIFGLVGAIFICYKLFEKDFEFKTIQYSILFGIIFICWLINRVAKNIHIARWLVLALFAIQFFGIIYVETKQGDKIKSENALENKFFSFKNEHFTVFDGRD